MRTPVDMLRRALGKKDEHPFRIHDLVVSKRADFDDRSNLKVFGVRRMKGKDMILVGPADGTESDATWRKACKYNRRTQTPHRNTSHSEKRKPRIQPQEVVLRHALRGRY